MADQMLLFTTDFLSVFSRVFYLRLLSSIYNDSRNFKRFGGGGEYEITSVTIKADIL